MIGMMIRTTLAVAVASYAVGVVHIVGDTTLSNTQTQKID